MGFPGGSVVKNRPANAGDVGSIPGLGRAPGEGNGNPLQYSCLRNPMDWGDWRIESMGLQSRTQLSNWARIHTRWIQFQTKSYWHKSFSLFFLTVLVFYLLALKHFVSWPFSNRSFRGIERSKFQSTNLHIQKGPVRQSQQITQMGVSL